MNYSRYPDSFYSVQFLICNLHFKKCSMFLICAFLILLIGQLRVIFLEPGVVLLAALSLK